MGDREEVGVLETYYDRRAREYERVYHRDDPVRRREQEALAGAIRTALAGRRVLEVACGTGYWTRVAAGVAERVVGVDAAPATLAVAQAKPWPPGRVRFVRGDAYALDAVPGAFDAGLATFWLSHVPRTRLEAFVSGLHRRLGGGAVVFLADNVYVPGVGGELVVRPGSPDTFKRRALDDGTTYEVLKNYYTTDELRHLLGPYGEGLSVRAGPCFWWATYTTTAAGDAA